MDGCKMNLNLIKYPSSNFFKFKDGVNIEDKIIEKEINNGISLIIEDLQNGIDSPYYYWSSGNTAIICLFTQDNIEDIFSDSNYFTIIIAKNFESVDLSLGELKEKNGCSLSLNKILENAKIGDTINYNGFHLVLKDKEK